MKMNTEKLCSISGCGGPAIKRGWCNAHYKRWQRNGDPLGGRTPCGEAHAFLTDVLKIDTDDCVEWPYSRGTGGYGRISINGRTRIVSQVVCEMARGPRPSLKHGAAHSCGSGHLGCVNPRHLRWRTHKENMREMVEHGRSPAGSRHAHAVLTERQIVTIRSLGDTRSRTEIARMFNVSVCAISKICRRKAWRHVA